MSKRKNNIIYAFYKGDEFVCDGTLEEISGKTEITVQNLCYYKTPSYLKRTNESTASRLIPIGIKKESEKRKPLDIKINQQFLYEYLLVNGYNASDFLYIVTPNYDRMYNIYSNRAKIQLEEFIKICLIINEDPRKFMEV